MTSTDRGSTGAEAARIGVLVVAYTAATTLRQTLDHMPSGFPDQLDRVLGYQFVDKLERF